MATLNGDFGFICRVAFSGRAVIPAGYLREPVNRGEDWRVDVADDVVGEAGLYVGEPGAAAVDEPGCC